jgi:hypothetical protein
MKPRLTNDEIIKQAVKFIGDEACQLGVTALVKAENSAKAKVLDDLQRSEDRRPLECWRALIRALDQIDAAEGDQELKSVSKNVKTLRPFEDTLRRLRIQFQNLPDSLRYPLLSTQFDDHCKVWLDVCKKLRTQPRGKPKRDDGLRKRLAAEQALILLRKCRPEIQIKTSRDGRYFSLAATLFGYPSADLKRFCREQIKLQNRV